MPFPVGGSAVSHSGTYIPEIWSGKLLQKFYAATCLSKIANTDYEGEITAQGDKVIIRTVPDITISDYVKGAGLTVQDPTPGKVELLIDKGKYFAFNVYRVDEKQGDINFMEKWSDDAGYQMKLTIERSIFADIPVDADAANKGLTAGKIAGNINLGAAGNPVELSNDNVTNKLVEVEQVLAEQDVPETERSCIIPAWMATRIKTSELKDASLSGDGTSMLRNGRLGRLSTLTLYSSNTLNHAQDATTLQECFDVIAGHRSALTFASQLIENETVPNPNDFGQIVRGLQVYGYEVIKPEALVHLYCTPVALV